MFSQPQNQELFSKGSVAYSNGGGGSHTERKQPRSGTHLPLLLLIFIC